MFFNVFHFSFFISLLWRETRFGRVRDGREYIFDLINEEEHALFTLSMFFNYTKTLYIYNYFF